MIGPLLGVGIIKYFENIFSALNESALREVFDFLPDPIADGAVFLTHQFVGEGWHLTLGVLFVVVVIFLPGGVMEGITKLNNWIQQKFSGSANSDKNKPSEVDIKITGSAGEQ